MEEGEGLDMRLHVHVCLGVGPLIASFMFGVLLIEYKGYVYVMVCVYLFLSDHTQYAAGPFGTRVDLCNWVWCRVAEIIACGRLTRLVCACTGENSSIVYNIMRMVLLPSSLC